MLGFVWRLSLRVVAALLIFGVLVAHQWGWSEYASPQLYVVYYKLVDGHPDYAIVNADGSAPSQELAWKDEPITRLDCSPDGRVFAALTASGHLYVLTAAGLLYDKVETMLSPIVNVANDGTVDLFEPDNSRLLVNSQVMNLSTPNQPVHRQDQFDVSAQGFVLWSQDFQSIQVISLATGEVIASLPRGFSGKWFASGQIFSYTVLRADPDGVLIDGGSFVMDVNRQTTVRIGYWALGSPLSPDGTQVAAALTTKKSSRRVQTVVYNLFGARHLRQLTNDPEIASQPMCFLAFWPSLAVVGK